MIDSATRRFVFARAGNRCEYWQLPQEANASTFNIDHVTALQHVQDDSVGNLAVSCPKCNRKKGPNLAGIDPLTRAVIVLFHPRHDKWTGLRGYDQTPAWVNGRPS